MEEVFYEIECARSRSQSFSVMSTQGRAEAGLPGYHGRGSLGPGRLVYSDNGRTTPKPRAAGIRAGPRAMGRHERKWEVVRLNHHRGHRPGRNQRQRTAASDPIGPSAGIIARSFSWCSTRASGTPTDSQGDHSYDGAHGWNTEWPRIRDIGEDNC